MKGIILDFSIQENSGVIYGDDQQHYDFTATEWKDRKPPIAGERVNFASDASNKAIQIYVAQNSNNSPSQASILFALFSDQNKPEDQYNMIDWFVKSMKNYTNFTGRARRKEFWSFTLMCIIISLIAQMIDAILLKGQLVLLVTNIALLVPSLSLGARRLHDIDRTGWWQLIMFTLIGIIFLIAWWARNTDRRKNEWGAPAKQNQFNLY